MSKDDIHNRTTLPDRPAARVPVHISNAMRGEEEPPSERDLYLKAHGIKVPTGTSDTQRIIDQQKTIADLRFENEALRNQLSAVRNLVESVGTSMLTTPFGRDYEDRDRPGRITDCLRGFYRTYPALYALVDSKISGGTSIEDTLSRDIYWLKTIFAFLPKADHK